VAAHEDIVGNQTTDQMARTGSEYPFIRPEPVCGISTGVAKRAVRDWTNSSHKDLWEPTAGPKQAKGLVSGSSVRSTKDLLKPNRDQLTCMVELRVFTGHCHLKGCLFKL
jgi:hypothetical protein